MRTYLKSHDEQIAVGLRDSLAVLQATLSLPQLVALLTIGAEPGLSVNDLANQMKIAQQSASRHVTVLTGRYQAELADTHLEALIMQEINESDPRKRALFLTPAGAELIANITHALRAKI